MNVVTKNAVGNQKKKCYNCDKERHFAKDYRQLKKLPWKPVPQKNANTANAERSIAMVERMLPPIDFGNVFTSIPLNVLNIELKENSDTDESEELNIDIWIYLTSKRKYKEFTVMGVNLNIARNDGEEYLYKEDDPYLEPNNVRHYSIIWMNCIYNYCIFHLGSKAINNFFPKAMFRSIKKTYTFEETEHWIFTTRTAIYRTFIPSFEYPPIYVKERATLEGYQEPSCLEHYLEKAKKWH